MSAEELTFEQWLEQDSAQRAHEEHERWMARGKMLRAPEEQLRMNHRQVLEACMAELRHVEPRQTLEVLTLERWREQVALAVLRDYLITYPRGGHLAGWLRDGARCRLSDACEQAYARGDERTMGVAGALLALTREQLEAVRRAAGVSADIGRVKPEGET